MQKILITGGAGFIASHLTERLLDMGCKVTGIDNFDPFYPREIKERNLSLFSAHHNYTFIEGDITDQDVWKNLKQASFDVVFHIAAKAGVRPSIQNPHAYIDTNITGTLNVLDFMRIQGIKNLVFASSSSIYGNLKQIPFSEDADVTRPISPYAFTKKTCELMTHTYHNLYDLNVLNLRFFTVYGPRQRPDLAIHKFVRLIKTGQPIPMFGDGSTARDYTFVSDLVGGLIQSMDYLDQHDKVYEIINLGNNQPVKLIELINHLYDLCGKTPQIDPQPMQPGDVDITYADISKAKRIIGYEPVTNIRDGLAQFISWYENQEDKSVNLT